MTKEELIVNSILEKAKTDKKFLKEAKIFAVEGKQFELASTLREIEKEYFPETDEIKEAKSHARNLMNVFGMVHLKVPIEACFLIDETMKVYKRKKGKFSIMDAADLIVKQEQTFN